MDRRTEGGSVEFVCFCGERVAGTPDDARIAGAVLRAENTSEKFYRLLRSVAHHRASERVMVPCPACHLDYVALAIVGEQRKAFYACKCGKTWPAADGKKASAEAAAATE
jgi:hypothetical protein